MKAEDIRLEELIRFQDGDIHMHTRRLIVHDFQALGQLQRDLLCMLGHDQARRVITRFGYFWGQADASSMMQLFHQWEDKSELLKAAARLHTIQGSAITDCEIVRFDEAKDILEMKCTWQRSGIAEAYMAEMGKAHEPVCWFHTGYMSGYVTYIIGKSVYFVENECLASGASHCTATGKDIDSWGSDIKPYIDNFHTIDIQWNIENLNQKLRDTVERLALESKQLERALTGSSLANVEIRSLEFQQILNIANKVAKFDSAVLLTGETGVGKDLLARHIHSFSPRAKGPYVAINCAALPDSLLESELFGHKAGSFTGAVRDKRGLFEEAHNGVIFLDEIGDISANMQSKLLRVLQEREIMRVGDTKPIKVDFRPICATNRDIEKAVMDGTFREDLFYRLQVIHIVIPPLRERREDILPLARHFVKKNSEKLGLPDLTLYPTCFDYLLAYNWPGNIRELENAIEHAAVMCTDNIISPEHLPMKIRQHAKEDDYQRKTSLSLEEVEFNHIRRVLELTNGNREEAAEILKIGVATLYRKLAIMKRFPAE